MVRVLVLRIRAMIAMTVMVPLVVGTGTCDLVAFAGARCADTGVAVFRRHVWNCAVVCDGRKKRTVVESKWEVV